ncbi:bifunctional 2-C-methyl-D-erythritol 4-phosphate cytidylyltransferase/2-C-methyl-D-erythritol 2,4-cyclodiphosphate synthase [Rickettsiales bacterium]|nr:bifunctional 2-C-methyl-D-erythritol 4-phosphate cytidylyltransferase/2-C-methyl-D-erythritol 2,4-cyclodiphosphate synthase [Rickettsiales bacterium]
MSHNRYRNIALIVAAGSGSRMGEEIPKQYMKLSGRELLNHAASAFLQNKNIDAVCVVYNPDYEQLYQNAVKDLDLLAPVIGGKTRQESVRLGLKAIEKFNPEIVMIHDAARPLVSQDLINRVFEKTKSHGAAIAALEVEDTIKRHKNGNIIETIDRKSFMRAQTPQGFKYKDILKAHMQIGDLSVTDDASIFEYFKKPVHIVKGSQLNFKITQSDDLQRAQRLMTDNSNCETRSGIGFDVHAFEKKAGDVVLCNVKIPHSKTLKGHSDADVAIHALVDAILGSIGKGDIGEHFPPSDNKFKNMDSSIFLQNAIGKLRYMNAKIINADLTIICEEPKITPHKPDMRKRLSKIMDVSEDRINIKATTTEKLGFTGRGEGIAAQAIVTISINS